MSELFSNTRDMKLQTEDQGKGRKQKAKYKKERRKGVIKLDLN